MVTFTTHSSNLNIVTMILLNIYIYAAAVVGATIIIEHSFNHAYDVCCNGAQLQVKWQVM